MSTVLGSTILEERIIEARCDFCGCWVKQKIIVKQKLDGTVSVSIFGVDGQVVTTRETHEGE
jgi:hypothetical protein